MRMIACMLGVILFGAIPSFAQTPPTPPPAAPLQPQDLTKLSTARAPLAPGPLLNPAPDLSQWTLTSTDVVLPPGEVPNPPVTATVSKTRKIYEVETLISGQKLVFWCKDIWAAVYLPGTSQPSVSNDSASHYYIDFSKSDFPELNWISAKNYKGVAQLGGTKVLVFKSAIPMPTASIVALTHHVPTNAIALIDLATHRPLMFQLGGEVLTYQFNRASPNLTLPKDVENAFNSELQRYQMGFPHPSG